MQLHHLNDDEFIHELSLRDDPVSKRVLELIDEKEEELAELTERDDEQERLVELGETLNEWLCKLPKGAEDYLAGIVADYEAARTWVCVDCLNVIANGEWPEVDQVRGQEIEDGVERLDIPTPGERIRESSSSQCQCCGTIMAGTRHEVFEVGKIR